MMTSFHKEKKWPGNKCRSVFPGNHKQLLVLFFVFLILAAGCSDDADYSDAEEVKIEEEGAASTKNASQEEDSYTAINELLQDRLGKLNHICSKVIANRSIDNLTLLQQEELSFYTEIESIRIEAASLTDLAKAKKIEDLLESFNKAASKKVATALNASSGEDNATAMESGVTQPEVQEIQRADIPTESVVKKEAKENPPALRPETDPTPELVSRRENSGEAAVWKERYEKLREENSKLKAMNNKYLVQSDELKKSYKEVVEDNRRLLAQLQAARAARN